MTLLLLLAAAQAGASLPSATPPVPPLAAPSGSPRYRACAEQVRTAPDSAILTANAWRRDGGGLEARLCLGLAYVALERWLDAAALFEQGAREAGASESQRASLLVQAGNARLAADEPQRAIADFDAALALASIPPGLRGQVHLDRARALVSLGDADGARADLDRATALVPGDAIAWYLSAALARRGADLARAQADIGRALALAADSPDIMLLAGTIAGLAGNMGEAERLYRRVAETAPDSDAGRAAAESLATLREIEVPAEPAAAPAPAASPVTGGPTATTPVPVPPRPQSR